MFCCKLISFLHQALAELYVIDGQYEKAFLLYADVSFRFVLSPLLTGSRTLLLFPFLIHI